MEINIAKNAGFCFGVERAVNKVYELIRSADENTHIYTLGEILHNPVISADFEQNGVRLIDGDELSELYGNATETNRIVLIIRTHGVTKELSEMLSGFNSPFFTVYDCTCQSVKKIHRIVSEQTDENSLLIIVGDKAHPEVIGIKSYSNGEVFVCSDENELYNHSYNYKRIIMVAQTTQKLSVWKKCQKNIQNLCTNPLIFDTICNVTENRQAEVDSLSRKSDVMIVIGGRKSSNTNKLFEIASGNCPLTYFIENSSELRNIKLGNNIKVGIAAGASTPNGIIEEVKNTMIDNEITKAGDAGENFEEMLESTLKTLNTGETVKGIVTYVSPNEIHVDLKAKVTGIIPLAQMTDDPSFKIEEHYKVGDEIEASVYRVSDIDGVATLSTKYMQYAKEWKRIQAAVDTDEVFEGKVSEVVKGGLIIVIGSTKVFVPGALTGYPKDYDLTPLLKTTQRVTIKEINEQRRRVLGSMKAVAANERREKQEALWGSIEKGKVYTGVVKSLTSYGAFVDIGGVDGMVHSSELSWKRIKHPSEVVSIGEEITVYVKDFDIEKKRISLGYKTEESDPWNIFNSKFKVGDTTHVKIVSLMPFGAFAEVIPGADGLIHISQICAERIKFPGDVLKVGEEVDAKIVDINTETRKISLSILALTEPQEEPQPEASAEAESKTE